MVGAEKRAEFSLMCNACAKACKLYTYARYARRPFLHLLWMIVVDGRATKTFEQPYLIPEMLALDSCAMLFIYSWALQTHPEWPDRYAHHQVSLTQQMQCSKRVTVCVYAKYT